MKRLSIYPRLFVLLVGLVFLSACERSLGSGEPTATPGVGATAPSFIIPATQTVPQQTAQPYPAITQSADGGVVTEPPVTEGTAVTTPETPLPTQPPPAGTAVPTVHTVQAGQTLGQIAEIYGVSINDIAVANNLADINTLDVGQQLIIPAPGSGDAAPPQTGERQHVVQAGDTLYRIGLLYGFTVEELVSYNGLTDPNSLEVGQVIRIPPES